MTRIEIDWSRCVLNMQNVGLPIVKQAEVIGHNDKGQFLSRIARRETRRMEFNTGLLLLDLRLKWCPARHRDLIERPRLRLVEQQEVCA